MDAIRRADAQDPAHTKSENRDNLAAQVDALTARDGSPIFAMVPHILMRAWPASDGAFKLFCLMLAREAMAQWDSEAGEREPVRTPPGGWHAAMGCSPRPARKWLGELKDALIVHGGRGRWKLNTAIFTMGDTAKVPLGDWQRIGPAEARLWAILCRYVNERTGACYPSIETMREQLRAAKRDAVFRRLKRLRALGLVKWTRRDPRKSGNIYYLANMGRVAPEAEPAPPPLTLRLFNTVEGGIGTKRDSASANRLETGLGIGSKRDSGIGSKRDSDRLETGLELKYLTKEEELEPERRATRERDAAAAPGSEDAQSPDASPPAIAGADVLATVEDRIAEAEGELRGWIARQEDAEAKGGLVGTRFARIAADKAQEARDRIAALQAEAA